MPKPEKRMQETLDISDEEPKCSGKALKMLELRFRLELLIYGLAPRILWSQLTPFSSTINLILRKGMDLNVCSFWSRPGSSRIVWVLQRRS